jgi:hypothetical protein
MAIRGSLVLALVTWATAAVGRSRLLGWAGQHGLGGLAFAVDAAAGMLPEARSMLAGAMPRGDKGRGSWAGRAGETARRAARVFETAVAHAARVAQEASNSGRPLVAAVVGGRGSGKTTTLRRLAADLRQVGVTVGGVCQPAHPDGLGYGIEDMSSGERRAFASAAAGNTGQPGFVFEPDGWAWAAAALKRAAAGAQVVFADEMGILEASGQGHAAAVRDALAVAGCRCGPSGRRSVLVLGVRTDAAAAVEAGLGPFDMRLDLPSAAGADEAFLSRVRAAACGVHVGHATAFSASARDGECGPEPMQAI